ncbi:MAG TPA: hypothetical protein P5211_08310, partial [Anaerolineae bacterium]|nr:hypothetical protein [Anaerolineae bacterium]
MIRAASVEGHHVIHLAPVAAWRFRVRALELANGLVVTSDPSARITGAVCALRAAGESRCRQENEKEQSRRDSQGPLHQAGRLR